MKYTCSFLLAILISLCLSFAVPFSFVSEAGAFGIPPAPPPNPVDLDNVNPSPPSGAIECKEYKVIVVT